jgi:anti-sigma B factor antagonist
MGGKDAPGGAMRRKVAPFPAFPAERQPLGNNLILTSPDRSLGKGLDMRVNIGQAEDGLVITVQEPRLDAAVAISFKDIVRDVHVPEGMPVILDLSQVEFIDSSGLGAIVGVMKLLGPTRPLEVAALSDAVRKLFRLTRMDTVFKIRPDAPKAQQISAAG